MLFPSLVTAVVAEGLLFALTSCGEAGKGGRREEKEGREGLPKIVTV